MAWFLLLSFVWLYLVFISPFIYVTQRSQRRKRIKKLLHLGVPKIAGNWILISSNVWDMDQWSQSNLFTRLLNSKLLQKNSTSMTRIDMYITIVTHMLINGIENFASVFGKQSETETTDTFGDENKKILILRKIQFLLLNGTKKYIIYISIRLCVVDGHKWRINTILELVHEKSNVRIASFGHHEWDKLSTGIYSVLNLLSARKLDCKNVAILVIIEERSGRESGRSIVPSSSSFGPVGRHQVDVELNVRSIEFFVYLSPLLESNFARRNIHSCKTGDIVLGKEIITSTSIINVLENQTSRLESSYSVSSGFVQVSIVGRSEYELREGEGKKGTK